MLIGFLTGIPAQLFDSGKLRDAVRDHDAFALPHGFRAGNALQLTVLKLHSLDAGWSAAFSGDHTSSGISQFLSQRAFPNDPNNFFAKELDAGGYALSGLNVLLEVEGKRNQEITVYNVRAVSRSDPIPTGAVVVVGTQGDMTRQMLFDMDSPSPIAMEQRDDGTPGQPFFQVQRIGLPDGHKETLALTFVAIRGAYSFNIAIDYEYGGQKFTQTVTRNGRPFRVAASLCPLPGVAKRLTEADRERLAGMRYGAANVSVFTPPYHMEAVQPARLCRELAS